jgi:hypothetical protein
MFKAIFQTQNEKNILQIAALLNLPLLEIDSGIIMNWRWSLY